MLPLSPIATCRPDDDEKGDASPLGRTLSVSTACTWPHSDDDDDDGEEDTQSTMVRSESTCTAYAWPVYEMKTMALPIPSLSSSEEPSASSLRRSDSYQSTTRKPMCRTLRAEDECRERLAEALSDDSPCDALSDVGLSDDEQSPTVQKQQTISATRRWEDLSEDEDEEGPVLATLPEEKKKWADLSDDEQTPAHTPAPKKATFDVPDEQPCSQGKKRWADLSEDEQTPGHHQDSKKSSDSDAEGDDWTQVTKKDNSDKKASQPAQVASEQAGRKADGMKPGGRWCKAASKVTTQGPNLKLPLSNPKPQNSARKPQGKKAAARKTPQKLLCRYRVCIEQDRAFNVVRKLLGDKGSHMKKINESTGAKLRIRGRGSGFLEGPDQIEADEPLMVCISAPSSEGFEIAVQAVENLLESVHDQYRKFCNDRKLRVPTLSVVQLEQPGH